MSGKMGLFDLPLELLNSIMGHLDMKDLARLQMVNTSAYHYIMMNRQFTMYNTSKFFTLYYKHRLFAMFLFPFVHPRFQLMAVDDNSQGEDDDQTMIVLDQSDEKLPNDCTTGNTALHIAASNGQLNVIDKMLEMERDGMYDIFDFPDTAYNQDALKYLKLTDHNRDCALTDLLNDEPNTPLHYISILPNDEDSAQSVLNAAVFLIRSGADLWKKGRAGNTCLAEAAQHGQLEMVKLFIDAFKALYNGHDDLTLYINEYNDYHENAVIMAARSSPEVLELLLQNGGDPNSMRRGYPILSIAASRFCLDRRDPLNIALYHRQITMRWSIPVPHLNLYDFVPENIPVNRFILVMKLLLQYGADASLAENSTGMKPMHIASMWGVTEAIEILLKSGNINPNEELNELNGWLPVHYVCRLGHIDSLQSLILNGAHAWDGDSIQNQGNENPQVSSLARVNVPAPLDILYIDAIKANIRDLISHRRSSSSSRRLSQ
ncbi:hypothetical protein MIR68_001462 [Amoeboaphelidium protococcarum]|nr:hypothetical protein MIR68_001462 [Amoeboaphelidium protococcarum]